MPPGFTRKPNRKPMENFVIGYLRLVTDGHRLREERKFIEKSIVMIHRVLGHPCCDDGTAVVDLITPYDNQLTNFLRTILQNNAIVRRSFRNSLFRILELLNKYLYDCCTETVTLSYGSVPPADVTVQFFDLITGDNIYSTTTTGGATQTIALPSRYFGVASLIKVCINVLVAPTSGDAFNVVTGSTTVVSRSTVGQTCSTTFGPLQTAYSITETT